MTLGVTGLKNANLNSWEKWSFHIKYFTQCSPDIRALTCFSICTYPFSDPYLHPNKINPEARMPPVSNIPIRLIIGLVKSRRFVSMCPHQYQHISIYIVRPYRIAPWVILFGYGWHSDDEGQTFNSVCDRKSHGTCESTPCSI